MDYLEEAEFDEDDDDYVALRKTAASSSKSSKARESPSAKTTATTTKSSSAKNPPAANASKSTTKVASSTVLNSTPGSILTMDEIRESQVKGMAELSKYRQSLKPFVSEKGMVLVTCVLCLSIVYVSHEFSLISKRS